MVSCPSPTLAAVVVNMLAVTTTSFAFHLPHHNSRAITRTTMLHSSRGEEMNNNMPTADEIMAQKGEAYNALSSFHETSTSQTQSDQVSSLLAGLDTMGLDGGSDEEVKADYWECADGAITYSVSMDPAAGIKKGRISKPYKSSVRIDMGELMSNNKKEKGLRLVESMQFDQSTLPFVRSISLGANVDVDSVDSSYSLDAMLPSASATEDEDYTSLPLLPSSLLNGIDPSAVEFVVEHTLAVSELERSRCFLLYGCINDANSNVNDNEPAMEDDDFAILAATTAAENAKRKRGNDQTAKDDRSYRLIGLILAEERKVMPTPDIVTPEIVDTTRTSLLKSDSESEAPSPLDFLEIKGQNDDEEEDKMERLMKSLENHNKQVIEEGMGVSDQNASEMQLYNVGMFGLTSGVWLGDAFIRESIIPSKLQQPSSRGFGKKGETKSNDDEEEDRFATWSIGVQKVTMQFEWDYGTSIAQKCNWGRCMGTATSLSSMANIRSEGLIVVNEARRMKKREEKRVILDFDGGNYIAGLIGSAYFRAPRYMTFSQKSQSIRREPHLTEYMIFFRPKSDEASSSATTSLGSIEDMDKVPEYYCSRSSRLYDSQDGSLMQGSTGFFALQQPEMGTE
eukprot:scaffold2366_cov122-Skeletonema_dohrnii-CCMP3373.AAC.15